MQFTLNKSITIKTNLLTILIVCTLLVIVVLLCLTNGLQNAVLATISEKQVDSVTIYEQFGERSATLCETDMHDLSYLLRHVRLTGHSVRLAAADQINPQYAVRLKSGLQFTISCYDDYYIINGRGYAVKSTQTEHHRAIGELYLKQLSNREYFP